AANRLGLEKGRSDSGACERPRANAAGQATAHDDDVGFVIAPEARIGRPARFRVAIEPEWNVADRHERVGPRRSSALSCRTVSLLDAGSDRGQRGVRPGSDHRRKGFSLRLTSQFGLKRWSDPSLTPGAGHGTCGKKGTEDPYVPDGTARQARGVRG